MSDGRVTEIINRWKDYAPEPQCEQWWWSAIRHCQRNMDDMCDHEMGEDTDQPDVHPDMYDGKAYAHAAADIHYLLSLIGEVSDGQDI